MAYIFNPDAARPVLRSQLWDLVEDIKIWTDAVEWSSYHVPRKPDSNAAIHLQCAATIGIKDGFKIRSFLITLRVVEILQNPHPP